MLGIETTLIHFCALLPRDKWIFILLVWGFFFFERTSDAQIGCRGDQISFPGHKARD